MKKLLFILLSTSLISACIYTPKELVWPDSIPAPGYFRDYYAQDTANQKVLRERTYLEWVKKFYLGSALYHRGWNMMIDELAASLDNIDDKNLAREKLHQLGKRISAEWAKDSRYRAIETRHISIWGNALLESINKKEQLILIAKIEKDANALLIKAIKPDSINDKRYYQPRKWDDF